MGSISKKIVEALNKQINAEIYSAYLYLSMATYFESIGLKGFANWMRVQWEEELSHAMRIYDYVVGRGGRVRLFAIEQPPSDWESPLAVFEAVYQHEINVTKRIHELVDLALSEKDYATYNMLQWFVEEQIEEEASPLEIVEKLKLIGDDKSALLTIDRELSERQFTSPADSK